MNGENMEMLFSELNDIYNEHCIFYNMIKSNFKNPEIAINALNEAGKLLDICLDEITKEYNNSHKIKLL